MIPVTQTAFGEVGNCFSACLASLLHLPIDQVPYFMEQGKWYERAQAWLRRRGLYLVAFHYGAWEPPGYYVLGGTSPRSTRPQDKHAVVAFGSEMIHDPHPSRAGLTSRDDMMVLVPLDPSAVRQ